MNRVLFLLLVAACEHEPSTTDTSADSALEPIKCVATFGDQCGCSSYCMTPEEMEEVESGFICDLGCTEVNWTCEVVDGKCEIVR